MALLLFAALLVSSSSADSNHFYQGYCTWDAAEQAHSAWGVFPPWYGDAGDWIDGARASGWHLSSQPQANSIIAMPPDDQGSGPLGHVGWVLGIEDDNTTVDVRSMNWTGRGVITMHQVQADGSVQFLTPPQPQKLMTSVN
jgi:surface antigen